MLRPRFIRMEFSAHANGGPRRMASGYRDDTSLGKRNFMSLQRSSNNS